jgi:hypothetical protein
MLELAMLATDRSTYQNYAVFQRACKLMFDEREMSVYRTVPVQP